MAITKDLLYDDSNVRVWLITGTSSGMGRSLVKSALDRNDKVIATARVLEQIQGLRSFADSSRLYLMQLDVTDSQDVINSKVTEAIAVWGRIDVLVNNAGTGVKMILEEGGYVHCSPPCHLLRCHLCCVQRRGDNPSVRNQRLRRHGRDLRRIAPHEKTPLWNDCHHGEQIRICERIPSSWPFHHEFFFKTPNFHSL